VRIEGEYSRHSGPSSMLRLEAPLWLAGRSQGPQIIGDWAIFSSRHLAELNGLQRLERCWLAVGSIAPGDPFQLEISRAHKSGELNSEPDPSPLCSIVAPVRGDSGIYPDARLLRDGPQASCVFAPGLGESWYLAGATINRFRSAAGKAVGERSDLKGKLVLSINPPGFAPLARRMGTRGRRTWSLSCCPRWHETPAWARLISVAPSRQSCGRVEQLRATHALSRPPGMGLCVALISARV